MEEAKLIVYEVQNQQSISTTDLLQQQRLAKLTAKEARPVAKFSNGSPFEFRNSIARFEQAVDNPGMSTKLKLLEMVQWLEGTAGEIVQCYLANRDADVAYAKARSQLDSLFGATCDSVVPLVHQISVGKSIAEIIS